MRSLSFLQNDDSFPVFFPAATIFFFSGAATAVLLQQRISVEAVRWDSALRLAAILMHFFFVFFFLAAIRTFARFLSARIAMPLKLRLPPGLPSSGPSDLT